MIQQAPTRPFEILLIDDNPGDIRLAREALNETATNSRVHAVRDGQEAMEYLHQCGNEEGDTPLPDLVFLDLNMPRKDGREVLAEIRGDERLAHIPVVILTTSESPSDILQAYRLHANSYVVKPLELDEFINVVKGVETFWLSMARLPSR